MTRITTFHRLRVAKVAAETEDARSLVFDIPVAQRDAFSYRPGQFLTVRVPSDQAPVARCYSLSSSPHCDKSLQVTVKRTAGGYGSNWLCDHAEPGLELDVLKPAGVFTPASLDDHLTLIAGGSGITPMMSIIKSVLHTGSGTLTLLYANRDEHSVIFRTQLHQLAQIYPERLHIIHWLESQQNLPDAESLRTILAPIKPDHTFLCGPVPFMDAAHTALRGLGVTRHAIHVERFASLHEDPFKHAVQAGSDAAATATVSAQSEGGAPQHSAKTSGTTVEVRMDGQSRTLTWPPGTRLLDVLLDAGLEAPYSCREGLCAACECQLLEGKVSMVNNEVIDDEDIAAGMILACQALPESDAVRVTYDRS